jgi:hypothetical protein
MHRVVSRGAVDSDRRRRDPPDAALDQQLEVGRARPVLVETEPQRVIQPIEAEVLGAPLVVAVQERAVMNATL